MPVSGIRNPLTGQMEYTDSLGNPVNADGSPIQTMTAAPIPTPTPTPVPVTPVGQEQMDAVKAGRGLPATPNMPQVQAPMNNGMPNMIPVTDTTVSVNSGGTQNTFTKNIVDNALLNKSNEFAKQAVAAEATTPVIPQFTMPDGTQLNYSTQADIESRLKQAEGAEQAKYAATSEEKLAELGGKSVSEKNKEIQDNIDKASKIAEDARQEVLNSPSIDPANFFKSRNTAQTILGGISLFLSGVTNDNTVVEMIDKAINRDIDAQKSNFLQKQSKAKEAKEGVGVAKEDLADFNLRMAGLKAGVMDKYKQQLDLLASTSKDPAARQKAEVLSKQLDAKNLQNQATLNSSTASTVKTTPTTVVTKKTDMVSTAPAKSSEGDSNVLGIKLPASIGLGTGTYTARTKDEAKETRKAVQHADKMTSIFNQIKEIVKENPILARNPASVTNKQLDTLKSMMTIATAVKDQGNRLSDADQKFYANMVGDPTALLQTANLARTQLLINNLKRDIAGELSVVTTDFSNPFEKPAGSK